MVSTPVGLTHSIPLLYFTWGMFPSIIDNCVSSRLRSPDSASFHDVRSKRNTIPMYPYMIPHSLHMDLSQSGVFMLGNWLQVAARLWRKTGETMLNIHKGCRPGRGLQGYLANWNKWSAASASLHFSLDGVWLRDKGKYWLIHTVGGTAR